MGTYINDVYPEEVIQRMGFTVEHEVAEEYYKFRESEPLGDLLDQVAEEACELAQACIKYKRALGLSCATKCPPQKALDNLFEEYSDVMECMEALKRAMAHESEDRPALPVKVFNDKVAWWSHYKHNRFLMRYHSDEIGYYGEHKDPQ